MAKEAKEIKETKKVNTWEIKDRTYRLTNGKSPLTYTIQTKHTRKKALLYWDEEAGKNREIRYATNQNSVFVDDQDGYATLGHVMFTDGSLVVPRQNQALQKLLSLYHPGAGKKWYEFDPLANKRKAADKLEKEVDAIGTLMDMEPEHVEAVLRAHYGQQVGTWEPKIQKGYAITLAKTDPQSFIALAKDEDIKLLGIVGAAFELNLLQVTNGGRNVEYKSKAVLTVPFESTPKAALVGYFKSDEGLELLKAIEKKLS